MKSYNERKNLLYVMFVIVLFVTIFIFSFAKANAADGIVYGENGTITRAEWIHDLVLVFDMSVEGDNYPDNYFSDLSSDNEYYYDMLLGVQFGLIDVEVGKPVNPHSLVTREFAAHTLNFCLGFQPDENSQYTYNDYEKCIYPVDDQIAINRGWFYLLEGSFSPDKNITTEEVEKMLFDAEIVIRDSVIDQFYNNDYKLVDNNIIEVPLGTVIEKCEGTSIRIVDSPVKISEGDKFVVFYNSLAEAYTAENVTKNGNDLIISVADITDEEVFDKIDAQGTIDADLTQVEAVDGTKIVFMDESSGKVYSNARVAERSIVSVNKTLKATKSLTLTDGMKADVTLKMKNPKIEYKINTTTKDVYAKLMGDAEIIYKVKLDGASALGSAVGVEDIRLINWTVPGIGGFSVALDIEAGGSVSGVNKGYITTGIGYSNTSGFRIIKGFQAEAFTLNVEAVVAVGLQAKLGITDIPGDPLEAYAYAKVGGKASLKNKDYGDDKLPKECVHFAAYVYAEYGATGSVKLGLTKKSISLSEELYNDKNSPVRIVKHYEDGKLVGTCTRDIEWSNGYYTKGSSRYSGSGWSSGDNSYGLDVEGKQIVLFTYTVDDDGNATITGYKGNSSIIIIPETIDGYQVTKIGNGAFKDNNVIQNVIIPDCVVLLGCGAFQNCKALDTVYIPRNVEVGAYVAQSSAYPGPFQGCISLEDITFAEGTTKISEGLFYNSGIRRLIIPDTVTSIGYKAFASCENLSVIEWNNSLQTLGASSFYNCTLLEKVILPDSVTTIGCGAFQNCSALSELYLPKNVKAGSYAGVNSSYPGPFQGCTTLKRVKFAEGTSVVSRGILCGSGVEEITLPDTVTTLEEDAWGNSGGAFENCKNLKKIIFSDSLTYIGRSSFENCTALEEVILPDSVTTIGCAAFQNCVAISKIYFPAKMAMASSTGANSAYPPPFSGCSGLKEIEFGNNITTIPGFSFYKTGIEKVTIPSTVTNIGNSAFRYCYNLREIDIPDSVTVMGTYALGNTALTKVTVPDSVSNMGTGTFYDCVALANVRLPENRKNIVESMFYGCTSLKQIVLPTSVTTIQSSAFSGCTALETIEWSESITTIQKAAFQNCDGLVNIEIPETVTSIGDNVFNDCDSLVKIVIPNSVSSIGSKLFYDCDALTNVSLGTGITSIPVSCFEHCDVLENIVLPYRIASIGNTAFKDCVMFTSITIPRATTSISTTAFSYPAKMTIYGVAGTYAETYANEQGIKFISSEVKATAANLSQSSLVLNKGTNETLVLSVTPSNFTDEVTWKCTDAEIATISDSGLVTAKTVGKATIKVMVGDVSAFCEVVVVQPVTSISLNKTSLTMEALDTYQLAASVQPSNAANQEIEWLSDNENVATVDATGKVTALAKGSTTITAKAKDGSDVGRGCTVTVSNSAHIVTSVEEMESVHNYENNCSDFWIYTDKGAGKVLKVTFDESTEVEKDFDFIYIYGEDGTQIGKYTGKQLSGVTVMVPGNTVRIKLVSDNAGNAWGFKVASIVTSVDEHIHSSDYDIRNAKDATVFEEGYTGDKYCKDCGEKLEAGEKVEKLTPTLVLSVEEVTLKVNTSIKIQVLDIASGDYIVKWESSNDEIVSVDSEGDVTAKDKTGKSAIIVTLASGLDKTVNVTVTNSSEGTEHTHDYSSEIIKQPTCTEEGSVEYMCSCGDSYIEAIPASGHNWDNGIITKDVTCTENGSATYTCSVCQTTKTEEIVAAGHIGETELRNAAEATCTSEGYTGDTYCGTCGDLISAGSIIPKSEHTWNAGIITKAATCTAAGEKTLTCTVCGATETEVVAAIGHSAETMIKNAKTATSTEPGYTGDVYCKVCGALIRKGQAIAATGTPGLAAGTVIKDTVTNGIYKVAGDGLTVEYTKPANAKKATVVIPDVVNYQGVNCRVTYIAANAFKGNKYIKKVRIGNNIISIGSSSFYGCKKLTSVTFGGSVTTIGAKAFYKCTALKKVTIPGSVISIGKQAFYGCKKLQTITIKSKALTKKTIGSKAFKGIYSKPTVKVPKKVAKTYKKILPAKGISKKAVWKQF